MAEIFGLTDYVVLPQKCGLLDGTWTIAVMPKTVVTECSRCGSTSLKKHTPYVRNIMHVPVGSKRTQLRILIPRAYCKDCKSTSSPELPQILPNRSLTVDLREYMLALYQSRQIFAQIALQSGVSERTTARVVKQRIEEIDDMRSRALVLPASIGIDDIRIHRGEDGIWTHVVNLKTGETIDILPGTSSALVQLFLGSLRDVGATTGYCSDGADQYIAAGKNNFPAATRTLNPFHIVKYLFEGFDAVRSAAGQKAKDPAHSEADPADGTIDQLEDEK
jgi:transposase